MVKQMNSLYSVDVFCEVIDNFGDAGVSWRLARALSSRGLSVRLWINDLSCLQRLRPSVDELLTEQVVDGFQVIAWNDQAVMNYQPADLVIEAFACRLSDAMLVRMAEAKPTTAWINLEYLSAESWAMQSHGLPSPHPRLPLTQYFFFPGFISESGGLLREDGLLQARAAFDTESRSAFLKNLDIDVGFDSLLVSLFCYEQAPVHELFNAMRFGPPTLCLVPEGIATKALANFLGNDLSVGRQVTDGQLTIKIIPFLDPDDFDRLLWSCDVNFVRGEDSLVRAHWAQQPFVWQLYQQAEESHLIKLADFLDIHCLDLNEESANALKTFWHAWNGESGAILDWSAFSKALPALVPHYRQWSTYVASVEELSTQLIRFAGKIR
jgi:uncharacterized repeat protein (TIGR03837 family)